MRRQTKSWPAERCAIPLNQAWYCESCHVISNDETCCTCASAEHSQRLAPWLNREHEPISIPLTGVILSVTPAPKKRQHEVNCPPLPPALPRAS